MKPESHHMLFWRFRGLIIETVSGRSCWFELISTHYLNLNIQQQGILSELKGDGCNLNINE